MIHLPVDAIERQKFSSKTKMTGLPKKKSSAAILSKKREELKRSLRNFIGLTFPSSTNPYGYLMKSPGPIYSLEKFYIANKQDLRPPKYKIYFDITTNSFVCTLEFNNDIEYSDSMPTKLLSKLHVAHKVLMNIKRQMRENALRKKAAKDLAERLMAAKEMTDDITMFEANQVKDQPPKEFYLHPRVHSLWASKEREPEDNDWYMKNISCRNFFLFKEFYPSTDEPSIKRKINWN